MSKFLFLISLIGLMIFSCKKDSQIAIDDIFYHDITPDKEIQTVRFYTIQDHVVCVTNCPTPNDTVITYDLDLDNDQVANFRITCSHNMSTEYVGHCTAYIYSITIKGLAASDLIAINPDKMWVAYQMDSLIEITSLPQWNIEANLSLNSNYPGILGSTNSISDKYIGIKIGSKYGWIHISPIANNGIKIIEYAINLTENNTIETGQK